MSTPILSTKFFIPPLREDYVARPRLLEQLEAGLARKLILISAPAGFGKTTLLSEWVEANKNRRSVDFGWLSMDKADDAPTRFWRYFTCALQAVRPGLGATPLQMLEVSEPVPVERFLTVLLNEIAAVEKPLVLIVDDYHVIESPLIHQGMAFLLEHQPPSFHLALATRIDPPWPKARLHATRGILELRQDDLRFTPEEAAAFLQRATQLNLRREDVAMLEAHTEGWIAGLQMAALSMQRRPDARRFIADFTSSNRYIFDYLLEEVLQKQTPAVQDFLLKTAILDRISAPLCDAVLERRDSAEILAELERANLFLVPLDHERRWYRYHQLFAQLLQNYGRKIGLDYSPYHQRASLWLEANDWSAAALGHALQIGAFERAAKIAEENALVMLGQGGLGTLTAWLDSLPEDMVHTRPWLCVAQGWLAVYSGKLEATEQWVAQAEEQLRSRTPAPEPAAVQHITGHIAAIRSYATGLTGDRVRIIPLAQKALENLPPDDFTGRAMACTMLAISLWRQKGQIEESETILGKAIALAERQGNNQVTVLARCNLASLHQWRGELKQAVREYEHIIQSAKEGKIALPMIGMAYLALSRIYREQNALDEALQAAQQGLAISKQWGHGEFTLSGYIDLAEVLLARGDPQGALENMARARQMGGEFTWPSWLVALEIKMLLANDNLEAASALEKEFTPQSGSLALSEVAIHLSLARLWMAEHKWAEAEELLARINAMLSDTEMASRKIEALVLHALAQQGSGKNRQSVATLEDALFLAAGQDFVRVFLDEELAVVKLLKAVPFHSPNRKYARHLLNEFARTDAHKYPAKSALLVEPLTERELEVLRLLETTLDSKEIAARLVIAVSTARTHIRNIYAKLGVSRRMEAVQRAKELGLL